MKRKFPVHSYPWYVQDWHNSMSRMTMDLETRAFYRELLDYCITEGAFPDDPKVLAAIALCSESDAARLWEKVKHKFQQRGGALLNKKAADVRDLIQGRKGKISDARKQRANSETSPRHLKDDSDGSKRHHRDQEGEGEGEGEGEVLSGEFVVSENTKPEVSTSAIALAVATSGVGEVFDELKSIYRQAGKPIPEKHENIAVQLLLGIPQDRLPRVPNYVKWALASGTWGDAAHTKSLLNLLRDGDWDVEITQRTLPTPDKRQHRLTAEEIAAL
jgi:uncharacterized protein YdaU (DUF1376 family)